MSSHPSPTPKPPLPPLLASTQAEEAADLATPLQPSEPQNVKTPHTGHFSDMSSQSLSSEEFARKEEEADFLPITNVPAGVVKIASVPAATAGSESAVVGSEDENDGEREELKERRRRMRGKERERSGDTAGKGPAAIEAKSLYRVTPTYKYTQPNGAYSETQSRALHRVKSVLQLFERGTSGNEEYLYVYDPYWEGFVRSDEMRRFPAEKRMREPGDLRWSVRSQDEEGLFASAEEALRSAGGEGGGVARRRGLGVQLMPVTHGELSRTLSDPGRNRSLKTPPPLGSLEYAENLKIVSRMKRATIAGGKATERDVRNPEKGEESTLLHPIPKSYHPPTPAMITMPMTEIVSDPQTSWLNLDVTPDEPRFPPWVTGAGPSAPDPPQSPTFDRPATEMQNRGNTIAPNPLQSPTFGHPATEMQDRGNTMFSPRRLPENPMTLPPIIRKPEPPQPIGPGNVNQRPFFNPTLDPSVVVDVPREEILHTPVVQTQKTQGSTDHCVLILCLYAGMNSGRPRLARLPIPNNGPTEFDDQDLFLRIRGEYNKLRGVWRRLLSLKGLKYIGLIEYSKTRQLQQSPVHSKGFQTDNFSQDKLFQHFRRPHRVAGKHDWVDWAHKLRGSEKRYALEFVEGWKSDKVFFAGTVPIVLSIVAGVLWSLFGPGENYGGAFALGIFVLVLGWAIVALIAVLSYIG
ncbi:hypothetical protein RUND412_005220 [Rhizina undulata]